MLVTTKSGTVYDFSNDGVLVRRFGGAPMRKDGAWMRLVECSDITLGQPMRMVLDGVAEKVLTARVTTPVVKVFGRVQA